jgi:hypothetical protein
MRFVLGTEMVIVHFNAIFILKFEKIGLSGSESWNCCRSEDFL